MSWNPYDLDHIAQEIVLEVRRRAEEKFNKNNKKEDALNGHIKEVNETLNYAFKMRTMCSFGLERFWGEHLRLTAKKEKDKADFIVDTWKIFAVIMRRADIKLPPHLLPSNNVKPAEIKKATTQIWSLSAYERQASLAVLINLCDSIIWWVQRLKLKKATNSNEAKP
jgi:hypothetical protein